MTIAPQLDIDLTSTPGLGLSWRQEARCLGADPDVFYPEDEEDEGLEAKAICATCPVATTCLEHAIAVREKFGVWGGMNPRERRRIIRRRRRQAAAAVARTA